jgi:hypothetical protein
MISYSPSLNRDRQPPTRDGSPAITLTVYAPLFAATDKTTASAIEAAMTPRP